MNNIFNKIIDGNSPKDDIVGIIAYSIYQMREVEFLENYSKNNDGKKPSKNSMEQFMLTAGSEQSINSYRQEANQLLNSLIEVAFVKKMEDIEKVLPKKIVVEGNDEKKGFFYGVWQSVVGSVIFILLTGLIAFFVWSSKKGLGEVIREIFL